MTDWPGLVKCSVCLCRESYCALKVLEIFSPELLIAVGTPLTSLAVKMAGV